MGDRLNGYRAALAYLFERTTGGSRFGLERTAALLAALDNPHDRLRIFHVAGTNGKGSACATLEAYPGSSQPFYTGAGAWDGWCSAA